MQNNSVTFVTTLINIIDNANTNDNANENFSLETNINLFKYIARSGISICLFVSSEYENIGKDLENEYKNIKLMKIINLEDTETYNIINNLKPNLPLLRTDKYDTLNLIIHNNAKSEFVYNASLENPFNTEHFAWIDFNLFHMIKNIELTISQLQLFSNVIFKDSFLLFPCCWTPEKSKSLINYITSQVHWRFCGSFFIGDKESVKNMHILMLKELPNFIKHTGTNIIAWEVNIWAWLEVNYNWKIDYYIANHNDSILDIPKSYIYNLYNSNLETNKITYKITYKSTIVTFYFNITKLKDMTGEHKPQSFYMNKGRETLKLNYPMVIFCDEDNYKEIKIIRDEYIKNPELTNYIIKNITEYEFYKENWDIINDYRNTNKFYNNERYTASYVLITIFKIIAIYIAKQKNYYNTDYYAWIDFGGSHVIRDFNKSAVKMLNNPNQKISLCYIHYRGHDELYPMRTFYHNNKSFCGFASGVFTVEKECVNQFYNGCLSIFHDSLYNGAGISEELIFTYFFDKYPEICNIYYGDYYSVLENYHEPITDFLCIKLFFIDEAIKKGRKDLAVICAQKIITSVKKNKNNNINIGHNDLLYIESLLENASQISNLTNESESESNFIFTEANVFCIMLENNPRQINMKRRMTELDLSYTKWNASTPNTLIDNFKSDITNEFVKGCAQSHINIWRHIVNNNIEYALILEDDACFDKSWKIKLANFTKDNDWNCIMLSSSEPVDLLNTWVKATWQYSTIGYIISNKGAKWILEEFKDCFDRSDSMTIALQNHGNCYTHFPWLVIQDGLDTTIGSNIDYDNKKMFTNLDKINYSLENYVI
jgi:GR25 family glycosyltransferase involved in LPS biosynthesis